jgi:hypothetical protein
VCVTAREAIAAMFALVEHPERAAAALLRRLSARLLSLPAHTGHAAAPADAAARADVDARATTSDGDAGALAADSVKVKIEGEKRAEPSEAHEQVCTRMCVACVCVRS